MAATQLDIYNQALLDAAMQPLETITETSPKRTYLDIKYPTVAGSMLERFDWHFARIQSVALVKTANSGTFDDGFEFEYTIPADSASVRVLHAQYLPQTEFDFATIWEPDDEVEVIHTNLDEAYVIYTQALDFTLAASVARLTDTFVQALSLNLAAHLITRFSQDAKKTVLAIDMTSRATDMARAHSLGRGIGAIPRQTRSLRARRTRFNPEGFVGPFGFVP